MFAFRPENARSTRGSASRLARGLRTVVLLGIPGYFVMRDYTIRRRRAFMDPVYRFFHDGAVVPTESGVRYVQVVGAELDVGWTSSVLAVDFRLCDEGPVRADLDRLAKRRDDGIVEVGGGGLPGYRSFQFDSAEAPETQIQEFLAFAAQQRFSRSVPPRDEPAAQLAGVGPALGSSRPR